jgi:hypothetical protein
VSVDVTERGQVVMRGDVVLRARSVTHDRRRTRGVIALVVAASAVIPAALAFACNPQAYLTLDRSAYAPGDSVRVSGSFFRGDTNITVSIDRTGQTATVRTSGNGSFATSFPMPSSAATGGYTVSAIGYEANGDVIPGLPARASFSVRTAQAAPAPDPTPSTSAPSAPAPQTSAPAQSAPAQSAPAQAAPQVSRPTPSPSASRPAPTFREPTVFTEPNVQTSASSGGGSGGGGTTGSGGTSGNSGGTSGNNNGGTTGSGRGTIGGRSVFAGSVAPAVVAPAGVASAAPVTTPAAGRSATRSSGSAQVSPQTAAQTAAEDVWSSQQSSPSVLPVAGDGVAAGGSRTGSELTLGLLLLGAGALALIGMAAGETRRRRVRAR